MSEEKHTQIQFFACHTCTELLRRYDGKDGDLPCIICKSVYGSNEFVERVESRGGDAVPCLDKGGVVVPQWERITYNQAIEIINRVSGNMGTDRKVIRPRNRFADVDMVMDDGQ